MAGLSAKTEFLDVLDQCIAEVRAGRKTIERCIEDNPAHRSELAQLLPAAAAIVPVRVTLDPAQKLRARYALVEALHREAHGGSGFMAAFTGFRRRLASVAAAAVLAVAGSGVAVVAAQDAQPSDPLYGLKTAVEQRQIAFAASPEARAHLRVRFADRRLAEAERAIEAGREDVAVAAAAAYAETMQRAYDDIQSAQGSGISPAQASEAADDSLARVQDVAARAHLVGEQAAAAALLEARERAARERPSTRRDSPIRPSAQPAPSGEARVLVVATASVEPTDGPAGLAEPQDRPAPPPPPTTGIPAAIGARVPTPQPTRLPARGNATQGSPSEGQRPGSGSGDDREDHQDDDRGRGEGNQGGARSVPQVQPTRGAQAAPTAIRTATPGRAIDAPRGDQDRDEGAGERVGNGQGRGNDEGRGASPTPTPTAISRAGPSGDERPRATATATPTRATPAPSRSGNGGDGERDRDREADRRGGDRD